MEMIRAEKSLKAYGLCRFGIRKREDRVPRRSSQAAQTAHRAVVENRMEIMTHRVSPAEVASLTDAELLSLYLSLPPASREKAFINTAQAAEITGLSMRTIQLWIESGAVRAIAIGRKYKVVLDSLRAHLESQMSKCD
jgi:excisionase family DNA binding protein